MATITQIRNIREQGADDNIPLVSAFQRNSIEFEVERDGYSETSATVTIGGFVFSAYKTKTVGSIDTYMIDLTSILSQLVGGFPYDFNLNTLTKSIQIIINAYDPTGTFGPAETPIATLTDTETALCFGYLSIGTGSGMFGVYKKGSQRAIYHNGNISFYNSADSGTYTLTIGGVAYSYTLTKGYNIVWLNSTQKISGTLTHSGIETFSIPLIYSPVTGEEIAWLNSDGGWSFWNFRMIAKQINVKKSNGITTWYPTNVETISKSRDISSDKLVRYTFDTIAVDKIHYEQLCEMQESMAVIWNNKLVRIVDSSKEIGACKQNLKFNLTIEIDENVAGY